MNIFILDKDLKKSAEMLCDQHLNKQILELAQIICTVKHIELQEHYDIGSNRCVEDQEMFHEEFDKIPYKPTHWNHPVVKWATETHDNFQFCLMYNWLYLGEEFKYRFNKPHKSAITLIKYYDEFQPRVTITPFPIPNGIEVMKKKFKEWISRDKPLFPKWTNREIPECFKEVLK